METFSKVRWLFFDIGSTLVDEGPVYEDRFAKIAGQAGVPCEYVTETALGFYRQNRKGDAEVCSLLGVQKPKWDSGKERLYPDAEACLGRLSERYRIGIIANQQPGTAERLRAFGILQYIGVVAASAEEGTEKPDLRIFETALERAGCLPEEAAMIGDRIDNDIVPAKKLGMKTVRILQGYGQYRNPSCDGEKPDISVGSLTELADVLLRTGKTDGSCEDTPAVFRPAGAPDAAVIAGLRKIMWETTYRGIYPDELIDSYSAAEREKQDLEDILNPQYTTWIVEKDGRPAGYFGMTKEPEPYLRSLYLLPEERRKKTGTEIFAFLRQWCAERGADRFSCSCNAHNLSALSFYSAMGGKETGRVTGHENRREDQVWLAFSVQQVD